MIDLADVLSTSVVGSDVAAELTGLAALTQQFVVLVKTGRRGTGSGVVWRSDGVILTNHHVVAGHAQVEVVFSDDREMTATVIASDQTLDLAVLKVVATDLVAAPRGVSAQLRIGELVAAAGNPWGQRGVVTLGIVSGLGSVKVPWRGKPADYVRSDVQLAPGNSGGPLLNMDGCVVGINAMILGGDLSVAIPSDVVSQFVALTDRQPMLGIGIREVSVPDALAGQFGQSEALEVVELLPGGAAARAGVQVGDLLLTLSGAALTEAEKLRSALVQHPFGTRVALRVGRNGQVQTLEVELEGFGGQLFAA